MTNDRQSDRQTGRQNELDMQTEPDKQTDSVTVFVDSQNVNGKILQASCRYKRWHTHTRNKMVSNSRCHFIIFHKIQKLKKLPYAFIQKPDNTSSSLVPNFMCPLSTLVSAISLSSKMGARKYYEIWQKRGMSVGEKKEMLATETRKKSDSPTLSRPTLSFLLYAAWWCFKERLNPKSL